MTAMDVSYDESACLVSQRIILCLLCTGCIRVERVSDLVGRERDHWASCQSAFATQNAKSFRGGNVGW